ncbi:efflux RND transporter permease subunit [Fulvivirga ligni]|uniref:efflux RND transporter permease subunit n=1 Tax=Fulvivirga ligni TaxID=2904246 RepID=UPI001F3D76EA|nr:MMPL family transporter [Fulvivirga ligni]UII22006.1 MMPL family transporter [Fulvivirga ligni]
MWTKLAHIIIKYRLWLVLVLVAITAFMGYHARDVEMSYDFAKTVPSDDPDMVIFQNFKQEFGEDGNLVAIGLKDSAVYSAENFERFRELGQQISKFEGVNNVISLPQIQRLKKNAKEKKFELEYIFQGAPKSKAEFDSLFQLALDQKFYSGRLVNHTNGATLMLVSINKEVNNSSKRMDLTNNLVEAGTKFQEDTGIQLHYAGLPFVRSVVAGKVSKEMQFFLYLSIGVTALILFLFFRTWDAVVFPMTIIAVIVVWVMGSLALFGYKITLLTGLIPPVIVVIGIPNCVYLINKYHQEFEKHGNKFKAVSTVVRKIGLVTLITNFTTAIGFLVLASTDIVILKEFGIVAGINIMATFLVSIILIPAVFSWLPPPKNKQLKHLRFKGMDFILTQMDLLIHRHRMFIYIATTVIVIISVYGTLKIRAVSYMVDDLPEDSQVIKDLAFFEENFSGVMPLEIVVDTKEKRGVIDLKNLRKIERFEKFLASNRDISEPVSLVSFVKASKQAFYNNNPDRYSLPDRRERNFILPYMKGQSDNSGLFSSFVDSTLQKMRISMQVADIGSHKMDSLITQVIQPEIDSVFADSDITMDITGTTPLFIKGNNFLIKNLRMSLILAFIIIAVIMAILFANFRMIVISLVPNIIPLVITAGIMGFAGIPLKPSTALIFSIVFGISVDDSIHFLAKYRQELFGNKFFVPLAVSKSLRETGASMMYTSIILFFGFVIFAGSEFGGTVALGILTSVTLLIAMFTNLILLPSLLLTFDDGKRRKDAHPLIEQYDDGFYQEDEDEEIDLDLIRVDKEDTSKEINS